MFTKDFYFVYCDVLAPKELTVRHSLKAEKGLAKGQEVLKSMAGTGKKQRIVLGDKNSTVVKIALIQPAFVEKNSTNSVIVMSL